MNSIFEDGFIATEMKRTTTPIKRNTNYVWLTEQKTYPKTALPMLSVFPETMLETHMRHKGIVVDLEKIGQFFGNFYRFSFESTDSRLSKWYPSEERILARNNLEWVRMESIANKVGDNIRDFWFSRNDLYLVNFSLEIFQDGSWVSLLDNVSLGSLSIEQLSIVDVHRDISRQKCIQFGLPVSGAMLGSEYAT